MSDSIHDHQGEASANHHLMRVEYPSKRLSLGTGSTGVNLFHSHPIRTPEQNYYGTYPVSIAGRGPAHLQPLGFGIGANGTGLYLPPPRPGSMVVGIEPGRGRTLRLGEIPVTGAQGEIGFDQIDANGNQVRAQSYLPIQLKYAGNGFSVVTPIPRLDLTATPSGTPLFSELPANVSFQSFTDATSYELNINTAHRMVAREPKATLGPATNNSQALQAQAVQLQAQQAYEDFLSGKGGYYFTDPTQRIPSLYESLPAARQPKSNLARAQEILAKDVKKQDDFRKQAYQKFQKKSWRAWSKPAKGTIGSGTSLDRISNILNQVNQYLPEALQLLSSAKELSSNPSKVKTNSYEIDLEKLELIPLLNRQVGAINRRLRPRDRMRFVATEPRSLTFLGETWLEGRPTIFPPSFADSVDALNRQLPPRLQLKYFPRTQILRIAPGMRVTAQQGLVIPGSIKLQEKAIDRLKCSLPPVLQSRIQFDGTVSTSDQSETEREGLLNQLQDAIPPAFRRAIRTGEGGISFDLSHLAQGAIEELNPDLPEWMQLGLDNGQFSIGPLQLKQGGKGLEVDLDLGKLGGGFDLLDLFSEIPLNLKETKDLNVGVKYPFDRKGTVGKAAGFGLKSIVKPPKQTQSSDYLDFVKIPKSGSTGTTTPEETLSPEGQHPLLKVTEQLLSTLGQLSQQFGAGESETGYSPISGEQLTPSRPRGCPRLQPRQGLPAFPPLPSLPATRTSSSPLEEILLSAGASSAPEVVQKVDDLVLQSNPSSLDFQPAQLTLPQILNIIAVAGAVPPFSQAVGAISLELGAEAEELPTNTKDCNFQAGVGESLDQFLESLGVPPIDLGQLLTLPNQTLRDWVRAIDPRFVPALEYLLLGDLYRFYINWVFYLTGYDFTLYPERALQLRALVSQRYRSAAVSADPLETYREETYGNVV